MAIAESRDRDRPFARTVPLAGERAAVRILHRDGWRLEGCTAEIVRESRFRPVFRYRVSYTDPATGVGYERILIGKADYRRGGESTYDFMRRLWSAGFGDHPDMAIPEPVAYVDDLSLLLQTEAPGRCLYEWLAGPASGVATARAAGKWLSRLHALRIDGGARLPADYEPRKLGTYHAGLAEALPDRAARVGELTSRALDALRPFEHEMAVPTHGDYQPKNIYLDGSRVTVIDWDRGALGHPARDLGHFLGQSLTMSFARSGTFERVRPWNDSFLDGYGAGNPSDGALRAYVARTLLEVLYYKLVVKPVRDRGFVDPWLEELELLLES